MDGLEFVRIVGRRVPRLTMPEQAVTVVDTNVLLNLATPVVDGRSQAPSGADPLKALLTAYDVHTPASVLGEITDATGDDGLLAVAADIVLQAAHHLTSEYYRR